MHCWTTVCERRSDNTPAPVVRRLDSVIHWINLHPVDNTIQIAIPYPSDSNLSVGQRYLPFIQLGREPHHTKKI